MLNGSEPIEAEVDRSALEQIVLNLLDNAIKYGPAGQTVHVGVLPSDGHVQLQVDDEGPGVAPSDRKSVWKRFWRRQVSDRSQPRVHSILPHERLRNETVAGTGIGLSVVRELAALHGGRTWVDDAPGGGARFVVRLPIANGEGAGASHGRR